MGSKHDTTATVPDTLRETFRSVNLRIREVSTELQEQERHATVASAQEKLLDQLGAQLYSIAIDIVDRKALTQEALLAKADVVLSYADEHGDVGNRAAISLAHAIHDYFESTATQSDRRDRFK
jgi:hypothetical protein